jgi:hypothetical protein
MSTTHGTTETGAPPGAVPQPPPVLGTAPEPADPADGFARGGDTDVVFRLERDIPLVRRLRELASTAADGLFESWWMVLAGAVGLLALGALAAMLGGAYRGRKPVAPAPATAPAAAPTLTTMPRPPAPIPVEQLAPPPPARHRPHLARTRTAVVKKPTQAVPHPGARPGAPAHR